MKDSLYKTLIVDDRYKYILSGLTTTVIIAFCISTPYKNSKGNAL